MSYWCSAPGYQQKLAYESVASPLNLFAALLVLLGVNGKLARVSWEPYVRTDRYGLVTGLCLCIAGSVLTAKQHDAPPGFNFCPIRPPPRGYPPFMLWVPYAPSHTISREESAA